MEVENSRILATLSVGEFKEVMDEIYKKRKEKEEEEKPHTYVFGLSGIMEMFHCSKTTASYLKSTVIKDAVSQRGRKIVVDVEYARLLFKTKWPYKVYKRYNLGLDMD